MQSINKINSTSIQVNFFARKAQNSGFEFFISGQKNMKPVKAPLHAPKVRFMARSAASYGEAVLHKPPCQTWHGAARRAKTAEAFAFANMKQLPSSFHYAAASHFIPI